jgi:hypothetical protein
VPMALAKQAALAKRTRPDNHLHSFRRHHQRYAIGTRSRTGTEWT